jgi:hypothetical protein
MKSLEPENVNVPLRRSFDVSDAESYMIDPFKLHEPGGY